MTHLKMTHRADLKCPQHTQTHTHTHIVILWADGVMEVLTNPSVVVISQYMHIPNNHVVVVQSFSRVQLFPIPWTAAHQDSLSFTISQRLLRLVCIESVRPSNHLILCWPFSSWLQSFPASGPFPMSQLFESSGQSIGASTSAPVLPDP